MERGAAAAAVAHPLLLAESHGPAAAITRVEGDGRLSSLPSRFCRLQPGVLSLRREQFTLQRYRAGMGRFVLALERGQTLVNFGERVWLEHRECTASSE